MDDKTPSTLAMHTLLLCADAQFLGITRNVLNQLHVTPKNAAGSDAARAMIHSHEFEVIIMDWREIDNVADFLGAVRRSKQNADCVLVAIVRDLLDLRQAFAAGVHFLIHKPASAVQIERCLRAAYCATVARRRKQHREPVEILASVRTHSQPLAEALIVNLSEGGVGLQTGAQDFIEGVSVSAGEEIGLRFALPDTSEMVDVAGTVVWTTSDACGVRFRYVPEKQRLVLEQWLTECVERSLAEMCERVREVCA
ncbi:MAG: PilZ domain-containing protein [Candidatus Sulfotelmatobacter sp.]